MTTLIQESDSLKLVEKLIQISPANLARVFLLSTGSEAIEAAGQRVGLALLLMLMTIAIYNDVLRLVE